MRRKFSYIKSFFKYCLSVFQQTSHSLLYWQKYAHFYTYSNTCRMHINRRVCVQRHQEIMSVKWLLRIFRYVYRKDLQNIWRLMSVSCKSVIDDLIFSVAIKDVHTNKQYEHTHTSPTYASYTYASSMDYDSVCLWHWRKSLIFYC